MLPRGSAMTGRILVAVLALAAPAAAMRLDLEPAHRLLRPGQAVVVRWEGLPAGASEVELLLELPGGAVRLTESVGAASGGITLTVPAVAAPRARLRLRYGLGGRELPGPASRPFAIVPPAGVWALPGLAKGELWLGRGSRPLPPPGARAGEPWLLPANASAAAVPPPRRLPAAPPAAASLAAGGTRPAAPPAHPPAPRAPRDVPQRE